MPARHPRLRELATAAGIAAAAALIGTMLMPPPAHAQSQTRDAKPGADGPGPAAARLRFTVIVPNALFLGVGASPATAQDVQKIDGGPPIAAHLLAVSVYGHRGPIAVQATNHDHERPTTVADSAAGNTPMPEPGDDTRASDRPAADPASARHARMRTPSWTYSFANTVMARQGESLLPVVYTASMP